VSERVDGQSALPTKPKTKPKTVEGVSLFALQTIAPVRHERVSSSAFLPWFSACGLALENVCREMGDGCAVRIGDARTCARYGSRMQRFAAKTMAERELDPRGGRFTVRGKEEGNAGGVGSQV